ncbi:MAG: hypothetical protein JO011_07860, partial [Ktedonobacteraceae bacterium]|nr:hypothetical protein [Ktedonobacteraceae bacterium]
VPALFELLSGTRIGDLMNRVPALANRDGNAPASTDGTNSTIDATPTNANGTVASKQTTK